MGKVSIGLRGWRFDEEEVFDSEGNFRPIAEMDDDTAARLNRLTGIYDNPCHACWLEHGEREDCNVATVVYGEPSDEVLLCDEHEPDFTYWYEREGHEYRGTEVFAERFHEWFDAGNRAPAEYGAPEHVETDPADVPMPERPELAYRNVELAEDEQVEIDLEEGVAYEGEEVTERREKLERRKERAEDLDTDDLDLDSEYPT
jgi:hypothetical protein